MTERAEIQRAIAAQEQLRGVLPDDVIDTSIAALRAQLTAHSDVVVDASHGDQRRQATVIFADVAGFTTMSEALDAEIVAGLMNDLWAVVDEVIHGYGGWIDKHIGDAVMGVWGVAGSQEGDPERAVRAAIGLREVFTAFRDSHGVSVDIRVGVNTGPVLFGAVGTAGEQTVTGDAVNVASRLEHAAPPGTVLITHDTYRHVQGIFDVESVGPITLKGKSDPVRAYRVERAKPRAFRIPTRGVEGIETRIIGRDAELELLQSTFEEVLDQGRPRLLTILGEAGAGKSRLVDEFTTWLELRPEGIYYLKGRSVPDQQSVPRALLRELFADRFEIHDDDSRSGVAAKLRLGLEPLGEREATVLGHWLGFDLGDREAVRDLAGSPEFGSVARSHLLRYTGHIVGRSPMVVVFEDVHWADSDSLDTIEHVVERISAGPLLVVCVARPALLERRSWGTGSETDLVRIDALTDPEIRRLVHEILQRVDVVPEDLLDLVVSHSDGNPFHVEELIKMLIEDGVIVASSDGPWHVEFDRLVEINVPPTLTGVMQARLDVLTMGQRTALQHASVFGRVFWDRAVAALASDVDTEVDRRSITEEALSDIRDRELIRRQDRSVFSGCVEYAFKHALLRDATYETVLLRDRKRLHRAAADWLELRAGDRLVEHLGPIAEHRYRAGDFGRAADLLLQAGANAKRTGALPAAVAAYERALDLLGSAGADEGAVAAAARIQLGDVLTALRRFDVAAESFGLAEVAGEQLGDRALIAGALTGHLLVAVKLGDWEVASDLAIRARGHAEAVGGEQLARFLTAETSLLTHGPGAEVDRAVESSSRAIEIWRQLDDRSNELLAINVAAVACIEGGKFADADRWFTAGLSLARRIGDPWSEQMLLSNQTGFAHVRARSGDGDYTAVLALYREARARCLELGLPTEVETINLAQAEVEAGLLADAHAHVLEALRMSRDSGGTSGQSFALVVYGQHEIAAGRKEQGLAILGAVLSSYGTPSLEQEIESVVGLHGVDAEIAKRGLATGADIDIDALIQDLLSSETTPPRHGR